MKELVRVARLTFVLCLVAAGTSPMHAWADVSPVSGYQLPLRPSAGWSLRTASSSALAAALVVDLRDPDAVLRARQRLARHILAAGAGLALSPRSRRSTSCPIVILARRPGAAEVNGAWRAAPSYRRQRRKLYES